MPAIFRAVLVLSVLATMGFGQDKDLPKAFKQIIPRGAIAAITQPEFVSAEEADVDDDSWVLGVVINGTARAYSLNLLNSHEVVNDQLDEVAFAAVW